jgi:hypothetical protein
MMKNIATALVKAQKEFAPALKTATNPHFKSKYVGLDGCVEAVIDALNNNGIALIQKNHDCDDGVKVETIFLHESGEEYSGGILHVPAAKHDPQGYGSALTYARRYSLMATCGIAPEDDDGNAASGAVKKSPAPNLQQPPLNVRREIEAMRLCKNLDTLKEIYTKAVQHPQCTELEKVSLVTVKDEVKGFIESEEQLRQLEKGSK